jgi:hypothetical protein
MTHKTTYFVENIPQYYRFKRSIYHTKLQIQAI